MIDCGNFRPFNIKTVRNLVKTVDNAVNVFNQLQNVGAEVGNKVVRIEIAFNVTAELVGVVFNLVDFFVYFLELLAALFLQKNADGLVESHCRVDNFVMKRIDFVFEFFGVGKQRNSDIEHFRLSLCLFFFLAQDYYIAKFK